MGRYSIYGSDFFDDGAVTCLIGWCDTLGEAIYKTEKNRHWDYIKINDPNNPGVPAWEYRSDGVTDADIAKIYL